MHRLSVLVEWSRGSMVCFARLLEWASFGSLFLVAVFFMIQRRGYLAIVWYFGVV